MFSFKIFKFPSRLQEVHHEIWRGCSACPPRDLNSEEGFLPFSAEYISTKEIQPSQNNLIPDQVMGEKKS